MKKKRVFEKLLLRCEAAFLAKTPIIYICTDEIEMINQLLESDRLVTRLSWLSDRNKGEYRYIPYREVEPTNEIINYQTTLPHIQLGSKLSEYGNNCDNRSKEFPQITVVHMQSAPSDSQFDGLMKYVEDYVSETDDNSALRCSTVILYSSKIVLPEYLIPYAEFIDVDYPEEDEITEIIEEMMEQYQVAPFEDKRDFDDIKMSLAGFSCVQIRNLLRRILSADEDNGYNRIYDSDKVQEIIRSAKEQMLKRGQVLELEKVHAGKDEIGGMLQFIRWLDQQKESILQAGVLRREFGIHCPKGVLVCGVPGCGKSLAAETLSARLGIPLLKMDVGRLMGRYVGESEHNMLLALKLAEAMSPCILWIDELDKGFSSVGSGGSEDSGIFKRMFGSLLTWMQDNDKPCFIFATANSIAGMPKEFFRSGRFDALFSMHMPTFEECMDIMRKRMEKAASEVKKNENRNLFNEFTYNDQTLEKIMDSFCVADSQGNILRKRFVTGADIQKIVNTALTEIFHKFGCDKTDITPDEWKEAVISVMNEITVYGDGTENLDSIAVCYIRLIRNNFRPAARKVLFQQSDYHVLFDQNGNINVTLDEVAKDVLAIWPNYDRIMYRVLRERIIKLAPLIEQVERERLVR